MTAPRVVVLDHTAELGGAELALARLLEALRGGPFDTGVVLFSDGPLVARMRGLGVPVVVEPLDPAVATLGRHALTRPDSLARGGRAGLGLVRRLGAVLRAQGTDLVVANSLKSAVVGAALARTTGLPFVWHLHDRVSSDYLPAPAATGVRALARHAPHRLVVNSAATLATVAPLPAGRAVLAYPGLPEAAFDDVRGAPGEVPVVGMLGRVSPTKGQHLLLEAAAALRRSGVAARYRIVGSALFGEDDYERGLRRRAHDLGLDDVVDFAGWVDDPAAALRSFDVLVHASPVPEPFGQVVVEAMAAGVPVIGTDAGGVTEVLDPAGGTPPGPVRRTALGQLVRPGDATALEAAIRWTLENPDGARNAAVAARKSARERFTVAETAERVGDAWRQALADPPGGPLRPLTGPRPRGTSLPTPRGRR